MRNNNTIRYDVLSYQGLSALYALGLSLWAGTIYLYMKQVGYSYGQINLFLALFWLVTCLTEIPSGFFADMFGALKLTFLSSLFRGSGLLFLALFEHNLTILVLSAILTAVGDSFYSGTLTAWIVEKTKKTDLDQKAIMPSKYTDEIENSSYTWRVFYMSRKSKYSAEQKLAILNELTRSNISEVAKKYAVGKKTIRTWGYLYEYQGIDGLRSTHNNHRYSREFKLSLVQQYQKSDESLEIFAIKHGLKSKTQLSDWIMQYNESNLKAYTPRKRDSKMSGRKTDFEERLTIIEELIRHDVNYNWAVEKYHISYQQVYGWYQKYRKSGNDPESLRDRRGKAKPEEKWTEVDRLKAENRLLRAQLEKQEMEIAFAKKLTEIRNREVEKDSGTKPSKN